MGWEFSYCNSCGEGLPKSTPREVTDEQQECRQCHACNPPNVTRDDLLLELIERVEELETNVAKLLRNGL